MTQRLTGHFFIFGLVFFVLKTLLGIARQWRHENFAIFSLKPQGHDRTLVYQMWVVHHRSIIMTAFTYPYQPNRPGAGCSKPG